MNIRVAIGPEDAHGNGRAMAGAAVDDDRRIQICGPRVFLGDELFQGNVQPVLGLDDALFGQLPFLTNIDQNQVRILGDGQVKVIGGDDAEALGHILQHFLHSGDECRVRLGDVEFHGLGRGALHNGIAGFNPTAKAILFQALDILPAHCF